MILLRYMLTLIPGVRWSNDNVLVLSTVVIVTPSGYSQDCLRVQRIPISCRERRIIDQLGQELLAAFALRNTMDATKNSLTNWHELETCLCIELNSHIVARTFNCHSEEVKAMPETTLKSHAENHLSLKPTAGRFRHGVGFCSTAKCGRARAGQRL